MSDRLSRAEVAERKGVSRQRVDELVKEGRLTPGDDGKIDAGDADALWEAMDPAYLLRKEAAERTRGEEKAESTQKAHAENYNKARTAEAVVRAQSRRLDYEIKSGKYVLREQVKQGGFKAGKLLSSKLNNAANQLAPQLVGIKDVKAAHEIVQKFMTELAQDLRDELSSVG